MKNQAGFAFPYIMILSTAICMLAVFTAERYAQEKSFYQQAEERTVCDHLLLLAVKDFQTGAASGRIAAGSQGEWRYPKGTVSFMTAAKSEDVLTVTLAAQTADGWKKTGTLSYDTGLQRAVQWVEK